jgi:hypothetical protein
LLNLKTIKLRVFFLKLFVQEGFKYHHAEEAYLMMTYWIPDEPNMLPANASHQVGVGGFVINDQMEVSGSHVHTCFCFDGNRQAAFAFLNSDGVLFEQFFYQVLVVQEKYRGSSLDGVWKLPTGFILAVRIYSYVQGHQSSRCPCSCY